MTASHDPASTDIDDAGTQDLATLRQELAALRSHVARLEGLLPQAAEPPSAAPESTRPTSRRGAIGAAAAAIGGVVAMNLATASPAYANDPNDLTMGGTKNATTYTQGNYTGSTALGAAFLFQSGTSFDGSLSSYPAALGGWADAGAPQLHGVYGWSGVDGGSGVVASGSGSQGGIGVTAFGYGANLHLVPSGVAPAARSDAHTAGHLLETSDGELWLCVASGTPGTWRKIAGPSSAGAFHPIATARVLDTRAAAPLPGAITNTYKTISVAASRDGAGAVLNANVVPAGATAVTGNLTIVSQSGSGFVSLMPGDAGASVGSTINWSGAGQVVANAYVCKLDASRQVRAFVAGGSVHVILDVTGYYL